MRVEPEARAKPHCLVGGQAQDRRSLTSRRLSSRGQPCRSQPHDESRSRRTRGGITAEWWLSWQLAPRAVQQGFSHVHARVMILRCSHRRCLDDRRGSRCRWRRPNGSRCRDGVLRLLHRLRRRRGRRRSRRVGCLTRQDGWAKRNERDTECDEKQDWHGDEQRSPAGTTALPGSKAATCGCSDFFVRGQQLRSDDVHASAHVGHSAR